MKTSLALYQALRSINVEESKATAVVDALESDMQNVLATKSDLLVVKSDVKSDIAQLKSELQAQIAAMELRLTIRMGVMLSAFVGVILTAIRYMH